MRSPKTKSWRAESSNSEDVKEEVDHKKNREVDLDRGREVDLARIKEEIVREVREEVFFTFTVREAFKNVLADFVFFFSLIFR